MHWVSPGAAQQAFDYPIDPNTNQPYNVPVDAGSTRTFELNLDQEVPNMMVDQSTGNRFINLSVTALDGASENGYEIWAGPPDTNIPSEANARNLRVLNNPGAHSSQGATVYASGNLPMNSNTSNRVEIPLIYVDPDMIDQDIFISLFDTDAGAQPPITFYFDTIAQSDWSKTFAQSGVSDPDGQTRNCVPGNCHDIWVNPPYQIKVPGDTSNCDYNNPDPDDCTPFYGGRLMASYHGGGQDTYGWQITVSGVPYLVR
ncbi:MAG: hypothetical protein GY796_36120 [Chloroflexi bacterium]|nr:hypothetical protein [Chloroflexota bacterium]